MANLKQQFEIAFTSTAVNNLTKFQGQTGVKDSIAQPILKRIMKRRQEIQKAHPGMQMSEITPQLRQEFSGLSSVLTRNPLLSFDGT